MSVTVEARRLSGVDLGKTVAFTFVLGQHSGTRDLKGELIGLHHMRMNVQLIVTTPAGPASAYVKPTDPVTITGRKS